MELVLLFNPAICLLFSPLIVHLVSLMCRVLASLQRPLYCRPYTDNFS